MKQIFPVIPPSSASLWFLGLFLFFMIVMIFLFSYMIYASRHTRIEISEKNISISGLFYGRSIPLDRLIDEKIRIIDWNKESRYTPIRRSNGIGLPGYRSGWFRLRNNEKALLFVTDTNRIVYVPTMEGYVLMLSPENPGHFIEILKNTIQTFQK